jgi:hypothetical protein
MPSVTSQDYERSDQNHSEQRKSSKIHRITTILNRSFHRRNYASDQRLSPLKSNNSIKTSDKPGDKLVQKMASNS